MSDKTTIVNLADEHQGHQNQYRLYFLRLLSKVKLCLVFNNMHQIFTYTYIQKRTTRKKIFTGYFWVKSQQQS
jgi:hypothetical protein